MFYVHLQYHGKFSQSSSAKLIPALISWSSLLKADELSLVRNVW